MLSFAEAEFALSVRLEDGSTKREHLLSAYRQTGVEPAELTNAPQCPQSIVYLWEYFLELSRVRTGMVVGNTFIPASINYADIDAWARLSQRSLDPWELNAILELDKAFLATKG